MMNSTASAFFEKFTYRRIFSDRFKKFDAQVTFEYDQTETIKLPANTKIVALPNATQSINKISSTSAACTKQDATTIACKRTFQLKSRHIDPQQYKTLRTTMASLALVGHQPVILGGK